MEIIVKYGNMLYLMKILICIDDFPYSIIVIEENIQNKAMMKCTYKL